MVKLTFGVWIEWIPSISLGIKCKGTLSTIMPYSCIWLGHKSEFSVQNKGPC